MDGDTKTPTPRRGPPQAPRWLRVALLVLGGLALVVVLFLALRPDAVGVDLAEISTGVLEVTVEEDGRTRVQDRFQVTAPVPGTLRRITLQAGDAVSEGDALAYLERPASELTDDRTEARLRARLAAAEAGGERARALAEAAVAATFDAQEGVRRHEVLFEEGGTSVSALERARALLRVREAEARSAAFAVQAAIGEVEDVRAALEPDPERGGGATLALRAPATGVVLRVHRDDGGPVAPREALIEVGDPSALEVVVDLLSADAVLVPEGAEARIIRWGGPDTLRAHVRRVEPAGFTKVSALGIEEQRVNVILSPDEASRWSALGDGFRVEVEIVLDRATDVLLVPTGALVRRGERWSVFRAGRSRIEEVAVEIGRRSQTEAEVLSGLSEGDRVVVYPGDRVEDGTRYRARE